MTQVSPHVGRFGVCLQFGFVLIVKIGDIGFCDPEIALVACCLPAHLQSPADSLRVVRTGQAIEVLAGVWRMLFSVSSDLMDSMQRAILGSTPRRFGGHRIYILLTLLLAITGVDTLKRLFLCGVGLLSTTRTMEFGRPCSLSIECPHQIPYFRKTRILKLVAIVDISIGRLRKEIKDDVWLGLLLELRFILTLQGEEIVRWDPERALVPFFPQTDFQLGIYFRSKGCERQAIDMSQCDLQMCGNVKHAGEFHKCAQ